MLYILIGCIGFVLFVVYDLNEVYFHKTWLHPCFALGVAAVVFATVMAAYHGEAVLVFAAFLKWLFLLVAVLFLVLLVYSLFFALPFDKTYIKTDCRNVCNAGVYALCRHPGVLWFTLFYLFFWLFTGKDLLFWAFFGFSLLNIFYVWLQDRFFFPRVFVDYKAYQVTTPFLIPTAHSFRNCLNTIRVR